MFTRRDFLKSTAAAGAALGVGAALPGCATNGRADSDAGVEVNDVQSQLNLTRVRRIVTPRSIDDIQSALRAARRDGLAVSIAGGRHAMGGQQFGTDTVLLDMSQFNQVLRLDRVRGLVEAQGGTQWPGLMDFLAREQTGEAVPWAIREKQTGVDRVSLAGSLAANIHGRGLRFPPIVGDVESFVLVDAQGKAHHCSRRENTELFSLAIGGYGLFGVIAHVTLRLVRRAKVERIVEVIAVKDLLPWVDKRIAQGFLYGDCQYSTHFTEDAESHQGVFSCYRPVDQSTPMPAAKAHEMNGAAWAELYRLARTDKKRAFETYSKYYLSTSGQIYWSDTHQLAGSFEDYRKAVDVGRGTEMITELYVSKSAFSAFMAANRKDFLANNVDMTYGTIRFIEKDAETFLPWARESCVCIVCNLHVVHTPEGKAKAAADFRRMIDRAIEFGGRYYLTYHRYAEQRQVQTCYPQLTEFLHLKKKYDPRECFQSDWYRHYKRMFGV